MLDPILEKNIVIEAGVQTIYFNDQKIEWQEEF